VRKKRQRQTEVVDIIKFLYKMPVIQEAGKVLCIRIIGVCRLSSTRIKSDEINNNSFLHWMIVSRLC
jgi:UDP-N-acetylglucosamine enolpyruvyl transferase